MEKNKLKLLMHGRTSSDHGPDSPTVYRRAESSVVDRAKGSANSTNESLIDSEVSRDLSTCFDLLILGDQDQILKDEFDELMRSGSTMKVSLTPDRLKSMEVCNKRPCCPNFH
jgi:hypothetical protein